MKNALAVTGVAIVIAVLLSSPTFAQTSQPSPNAKPAPATISAEQVVAEPAADVPLDGLIEDAMTAEDRARMLLRCVGPPVRLLPTIRAEHEAPASEPAVPTDAR